MPASMRSFATNINCGSCVRSVTPFLDDLDGATSWRVDVGDDRKVLTVEGSATEAEIMEAVQEAGYTIKVLD